MLYSSGGEGRPCARGDNSSALVMVTAAAATAAVGIALPLAGD